MLEQPMPRGTLVAEVYTTAGQTSVTIDGLDAYRDKCYEIVIVGSVTGGSSWIKLSTNISYGLQYNTVLAPNYITRGASGMHLGALGEYGRCIHATLACTVNNNGWADAQYVIEGQYCYYNQNTHEVGFQHGMHPGGNVKSITISTEQYAFTLNTRIAVYKK